MDLDGQSLEYEPLKRASTRRVPAEAEPVKRSSLRHPSKNVHSFKDGLALADPNLAAPPASALKAKIEVWSNRRGHTFSFVVLFVYTVMAYLRPYDLTPALAWTFSLPYWLMVGLLAIFIPSQLIAEGNLTARPREVNLVLLLGLMALLSMPLAISPGLAWQSFNLSFMKTIIVFIVMVNAIRTEGRLRTMMLLSLAVGVYMSFMAMNNYGAVNAASVDNRAAAEISNFFGNPNSLAQYLSMMIPLAACLCLGESNIFKKLVYGAGALLMVAGILATLSRGGFLALLAAGAVFGFKLFRRNRPRAIGLILAAVIAAVLFAPGGYNERISSIADPSSESSASARRELLYRSISVSLHKPILGVGIGNFELVSIHGQVTHNAYTQVSSEMGIVALILYVMLMVGSYKRLRQIERETLPHHKHSRSYYLAVGLQASLGAYMVGSFFLSAAYEWSYVYPIIAYAICLGRLDDNRMAHGKDVAATFDARDLEEDPARAAPPFGDL
jgi:O-antigen ligase